MKPSRIFLLPFLVFLPILFNSCENTPIDGLRYNTFAEIYFSRLKLDTTVSHSVYSVSADGTNMKLVTKLGIITSAPYRNKMTLGRVDSVYFINNMYIANLDGTGAVEIPRNSNHPLYFQLSPDGSKVLFTCDEGYLFAANSDGTNLIQLSQNIHGAQNASAFSPDSKQIAFIETETGLGSFLTIINTDGTNPVRIKDSIHTSQDSKICWSPDGMKLAFDNLDLNNKTSVFVINKNGTGCVNLTNSDHFDYPSDWSPDGKSILYMKYDLSGIPDIGLINADGTGKRNLTNSSDIYERDSKWSPNGQKILFSSYTIILHVTKLKVMELISGKVTTAADSSAIGFWNHIY